MQIIYPTSALQLHGAISKVEALMPTMIRSGYPIDAKDPILSQILEEDIDLPPMASSFLTALGSGRNEEAIIIGNRLRATWKKKVPDVVDVQCLKLNTTRELTETLRNIVHSQALPLDVSYKITANCKSIESIDYSTLEQELEKIFQLDPRLKSITLILRNSWQNLRGQKTYKNNLHQDDLNLHWPNPDLSKYSLCRLNPAAYHYDLRMKFFATMLSGVSGDALGVPVEMTVSREALMDNPVTGMRSSYRGEKRYLPPGTWSDDSSMTFGSIDALTTAGLNPHYFALAFLRWILGKNYTATEEVFSFGESTSSSLINLMDGISPLESGNAKESQNGNGALMRISPMIFHGILAYNIDFLAEEYFDVLFQQVLIAAQITHGHPRNLLACLIYTFLGRFLLAGYPLWAALTLTKKMLVKRIKEESPLDREWTHFDPMFKADYREKPKEDVHSGVYVVDTLLASVWCLLNTDNLSSAILQSVNLGGDTDTTAMVTGTLAGLIYGYDAIPKEWIDQLQKKNEILLLLHRFYKSQFVLDH